jgi:hypothetical protein
MNIAQENPYLHLLGQIALDQLIKLPEDLTVLSLALKGLNASTLRGDSQGNLTRQAIVDLYKVGLIEYYRLLQKKSIMVGTDALSARQAADKKIFQLEEGTRTNHADSVVMHVAECYGVVSPSDSRTRWLTEFFASRGVAPIDPKPEFSI